MNPSDSIGLIDFLVLVYKFCKRNLLILILFPTIGFVIGLGYSYQKPNYYTSEMIGLSNILDINTLQEILQPLTKLVEEKNHPELASLLDISPEKAANIRNLNFSASRHTKTSHAPSATDKKLGGLILCTVEVYDQEILMDLENGISFFLGNNTFIKSTKELEDAKNSVLISEFSKTISLFDSLNREQKGNNSISIIEKTNPMHYKEAIDTIEKLKIQASTSQPLIIVSPFFQSKKPANNLWLIIIASIVAFTVLGFFIIVLRELAALAKEK